MAKPKTPKQCTAAISKLRKEITKLKALRKKLAKKKPKKKARKKRRKKKRR